MASRDHGLRADDGVVVRTPLLPLDVLLDWTACPDLAAARRYLAELVSTPAVAEALFVASPSLTASIDRWRTAPESPAGQQVEHALVKYVARMAGRTTPFGLFSGVSTGRLGRDTSIALAPRSAYQRRTRLDNDYLFLLTAELTSSPEVRARVRWRPSTSIYRIAGRLRYAAARLDGRDRSYHLVAVEPTPYLDATLARAVGGASLEALAAGLVADDAEITLEEAHGYLEELASAQLLVPDLGVHVTGPEPLDGLLAQLATAGLDQVGTVLTEAREALAALDRDGVGLPADRYTAIATGLGALPAKVDLSLLFQVDMVKPAEVTVSTRIAADLARTADTLATIWAPSESSSLDPFRRAFSERWEDREVPLAEVLDEESGIGFEAATGPGAEGSPLLAGIGFPAVPAAGGDRVSWNRAERHLQRRLSEVIATGATELVLGDDDVTAMKRDRAPRLPDGFGIMARIAGSADELARGEATVLFEGTSGPSGAKLLGRFCHASTEVDAIVRAHHAAEEALRPDAVFAEIVHLNEGRIGNILCRPVLRGHEIVYLGVSGAPDECQLALDDLLVSVQAGRIVLRSRRLGREVLPRLTTAHNYRLRSLGVYRFLCALAGQGVAQSMFSWGVLGEAPFLPRVRLGKVVLARATWNLGRHELTAVTAAVRAASKAAKAKPKAGPAPDAPAVDLRAPILAAVAALREARRLPRFIALAAGDNELPVDLDNPMLVAAFADEIAGERPVTLIELFPTPDRLPAHGPEGRFTLEAVLTFTRRGTPPVPARPTRPVTARRSFAPGSEWLYAKLYCGASTADRVLREAVAPVVRGALASGAADRWFFLRYGDPDHHVRVRLAGDPGRLAGEVLPALHAAVAPMLDAGEVHRVQLDTYHRETERYGGDRGIELVERIFWRDSEAVLAIVELLDGDAGADARWRLALRGLDGLLEVLGLDDAARGAAATTARDSMGSEHAADPAFWGRVGERFNRERADLELVFARDPARDADHALAPGFEILAARDLAMAADAAELRARDQAGELTPPVAELAWSVAHMHANRLLHASQRSQEMLLWDFLRRLHATRRARRSQT